MERTARKLAYMIEDAEDRLERARADYKRACNTLAKAFSNEDGPGFESSSVEGEWRELRTKIRMYADELTRLNILSTTFHAELPK